MIPASFWILFYRYKEIPSPKYKHSTKAELQSIVDELKEIQQSYPDIINNIYFHQVKTGVKLAFGKRRKYEVHIP
jgi:hypothetical protein